MILLVKLYLVLLEVGALAFGGGLATLPLLQQALVHDQAWLSATEWTDVFTISNMTPGPIAINAATFVGTKMGATLGLGLFGQVLGSIVASLGVITPQIILMTILAHLMFKGRTFKPLNWAIQALRSATVGLIAAITVNLFFTNLFPSGMEEGARAFISFGGIGLDLMAFIPFLAALYFLSKKTDMTKLLLGGAAFGVLVQLVLQAIPGV